MKQTTLLLLVAISSLRLMFAQGVNPAPASESVSRQADKLFATWDNTISPGCVLAAMKDGRIVYKRGYGMADLDHNVPITPATVFHVASMSKQFTAAVVVMLA